MRLTNTFPARRQSMLTSITAGRFGRGRVARKFPEEAERLITPAELKRLHA